MTSYQIHGGRPHEGGDVGVGGAVVDVVRRAQLLQHAALHHGDAAAQGHGLDLVVGDIDAGDAAALVQAFDFGPHFHAQLGIQVGQRLVEQKQLWLTGEGAAHRHPLALAAAELGGATVEQMFDLQHGGDLADALLALGLGDFSHFQRKTDVVGHAHRGVERVALKDHRNVALGGGHANDVALTDAYRPFGGFFQARDDVQQRAFATARRPDQNQKFARGHVNVDALEHFDLFVALAKGFAYALNVQCRCHDVCSFEIQPLTAPAVSPLTKYCPANI